MERSEAAVKTVIGEDIEIVGSIKCASNIQFDGKLNGDLNCNGKAAIGGTANIKGNISVDSTTILGQINGNIAAKDRIELKSTARVNGDIRAKRLTVEDGVTFVGKSEVNPSGSITGRPAAQAEMKTPVHEISPMKGEETDVADDEKTRAIKEEIKKDVKDEVKGKAGGLFGRK